MVLRLKMTLASAAAALMAVVASFAVVQATFLAALLSMIIAGALGAGVGYVFGGKTARSRMRRAAMRWATSPRL